MVNVPLFDIHFFFGAENKLISWLVVAFSHY